MTILWDPDPRAIDTYSFALGESADVMTHGPQVVRELEQSSRHPARLRNPAAFRAGHSSSTDAAPISSFIPTARASVD